MAPKMPVGEICLYGTSHTGAGFIARKDKEVFGTGELVSGRSFTDAYFYGMRALHAAGVTRGEVMVFEPEGRLVARVRMEPCWPCFGDLKWEAAPVYTLSVEALVSASKEREG